MMILCDAVVMGQLDSLLGKFPWLIDFAWMIAAVGLICLMVYLMRPGGPGVADFSIEIDGQEVLFRGKFPPASEGLVEDFLLHDCQIPGAYEIIGKWDEGRLTITVRGEQAKLQEQRIRNFLKLNVKRM